MTTPIVQLQQFIRAIRDAGYRGTGSALAEIVDNSFEAGADRVGIDIHTEPGNPTARVVVVSDDGHGMSPAVLELALQFGGSSRFGKRTGTGRFGMGLPNSSVSQARRLEVYTWTSPGRAWWSYLDVDEIAAGKLRAIPVPVRRRVPDEFQLRPTGSGTVVVWRKCDRLSLKRESALVKRLKRELGRIFRRALWTKKELRINGVVVLPVDPLFLRRGDNLEGASMYGDVLEYPVKHETDSERLAGKVLVRFVELPVAAWMSLSNAEKQAHGISKGAGVSVLRTGREIDFGWFFMGGKRKENYDDWWRCEIEFPPELDDSFGVTHTKQGITPSEYVSQLLTPDLEAIAHKLNARVRSTFLHLRGEKVLSSEQRAGECDRRFTPPKRLVSTEDPSSRVRAGTNAWGGLRFKLATEMSAAPEFYTPRAGPAELRVILNGQHPFCERIYKPLDTGQLCDMQGLARGLELLLFAAARAEIGTESSRAREVIAGFRRSWSDLVAAYLG